MSLSSSSSLCGGDERDKRNANVQIGEGRVYFKYGLYSVVARAKIRRRVVFVIARHYGARDESAGTQPLAYRVGVAHD